ncbi:hypothetical protein [Brachyspira hampsonii]|nr:hypothetical protein [Brachyspira hampsonii]
MNKKLFKLFLLVASFSLFAVSCANKSTEPEKDNGKTITVAKVLEVLKSVPKLEVGGETWDFSAITDLNSIPRLTSSTSGNAAMSDVMNALIAGAGPILEKNGIIASNPKVSGGNSGTKNPLTVSLSVGLADGYSADQEVQKIFANGLTLELIPSGNWK